MDAHPLRRREAERKHGIGHREGLVARGVEEVLEVRPRREVETGAHDEDVVERAGLPQGPDHPQRSVDAEVRLHLGVRAVASLAIEPGQEVLEGLGVRKTPGKELLAVEEPHRPAVFPDEAIREGGRRRPRPVQELAEVGETGVAGTARDRPLEVPDAPADGGHHARAVVLRALSR